MMKLHFVFDMITRYPYSILSSGYVCTKFGILLIYLFPKPKVNCIIPIAAILYKCTPKALAFGWEDSFLIPISLGSD